jgi:hypothetical protein
MLIHEHWRSFLLLKSSSISLFSGVYFSLHKSFTSFFKFIARHFIFFEPIGNGMFSHSLSPSVRCWYIERLLTFENWFCILLLGWRCLWCLGVLGWNFLGLLGIRSYYLDIRKAWLLLFLCEFPLFFTYCLSAMVRISKPMLNKTGENGHSFLISDIRANGFNFPYLGWCWT